MNKRCISLLLTCWLGLANVLADGVHFEYDGTKYSVETVIYISLVDSLDTPIDFNYWPIRHIDPETYEWVVTEGKAFNAYLGAFIDGECRDEVKIDYDLQKGDEPLVILRVGGDETTDIDKAITFRLYVEDGGWSGSDGICFYLPDNTARPFLGDASVGTPSDPVKIVFYEAQGLSFDTPNNEFVLDREVPFDLQPKMVFTPANASIPYDDIRINYDEANKGFCTFDGLIVTGHTKPTPGIGGNVQFFIPFIETKHAAPEEMSPDWYFGEATGEKNGLRYYGDCEIWVYYPATTATWQTQYQDGITIRVNDDWTLDDVLANGFDLTPNDAETAFAWTSGDETIVGKDDEGHWKALKRSGEPITMTGTATDHTGLTLQLAVKVVQPVEWVEFDKNDLYVAVGDDITELLESLAHPMPEDADDKGLEWTFKLSDTDPQPLQKVGDRMIAMAEGETVVTARATDGFDGSGELTVHVMPSIPKQLTAKEDPLYLMTAATLPVECTTDLLGNVNLQPSTLLLDNFQPVITTSDATIVSVSENKAFMEAEGDCNITITITVPDYDNYTYENANNNPPTKPLALTFAVSVTNTLRSFSMQPVVMKKGETGTLTLVPQPIGSSYDPALIAVNIQPAVALPEGWQYASHAANGTDGLTYSIDAKSIGHGTVEVHYDGVSFGQTTISVAQPVSLTDGWQWVSFCQGGYANVLEMQAAFGDKLIEARSQGELLYNDTKFGYFGDLAALSPLHTYKLDLQNADGASLGLTGTDYFGSLAQKAGDDDTEQVEVSLRKGWNWVGHPYQYEQALADALTAADFTAGDMVKGKNSFATFDGTAWQGTLTHFAPGQGYLFYVQNGGTLHLKREFTLGQKAETGSRPAFAPSVPSNMPWPVDHQHFADNMAVVAQVTGVADDSRATVYAFVGDECRGFGTAIGNRHFITVHGQAGERVRFVVYDPVSGGYFNALGSISWRDMRGTVADPLPVHAAEALSVEGVKVEAEPIHIIYTRTHARAVGASRLYVLNASGARIHSAKGSSIDLSRLPHGVYMVVAESGAENNARRAVKKIVR